MGASSPYCSICGALHAADANMCPACGAVLAAQPVPQSAQAATIRQPTLGLLPPHALLRQRYRILRRLGAGGFGAVYQAEDTDEGNRLVAIKEMQPSGFSPKELEEATQAFHQEASLLVELSHPGLPRVHQHFNEAGIWYLVMDFIAGETLEEHLLKHGGELPVKEVLKLGIRLCKVLHYLHTRQPPIIFRDLKPANVMLTPEGKIYLIDFGIARHFKRGKAHDTIAFGSPGYAAPEQYGKAQTTPRSDIYSLGVLLHQLLTGQDPAGSSSFQFAPLTVPAPEGLEKLLRQMTELDPQQRPPSMAAVEFKLEQQAKAWNQGHQVGGASVAAKPRQSRPASVSRLARRVTQPVGGWTIGGIIFLVLISFFACLLIADIVLGVVSGAHNTHGLPFEMHLLF